MDKHHKIRVLLGRVRGERRKQLALKLMQNPAAIGGLLRRKMELKVRPKRWALRVPEAEEAVAPVVDTAWAKPR